MTAARIAGMRSLVEGGGAAWVSSVSAVHRSKVLSAPVAFVNSRVATWLVDEGFAVRMSGPGKRIRLSKAGRRRAEDLGLEATGR